MYSVAGRAFDLLVAFKGGASNSKNPENVAIYGAMRMLRRGGVMTKGKVPLSICWLWE